MCHFNNVSVNPNWVKYCYLVLWDICRYNLIFVFVNLHVWSHLDHIIIYMIILYLDSNPEFLFFAIYQYFLDIEVTMKTKKMPLRPVPNLNLGTRYVPCLTKGAIVCAKPHLYFDITPPPRYLIPCNTTMWNVPVTGKQMTVSNGGKEDNNGQKGDKYFEDIFTIQSFLLLWTNFHASSLSPCTSHCCHHLSHTLTRQSIIESGGIYWMERGNLITLCGTYLFLFCNDSKLEGLKTWNSKAKAKILKLALNVFCSWTTFFNQGLLPPPLEIWVTTFAIILFDWLETSLIGIRLIGSHIKFLNIMNQKITRWIWISLTFSTIKSVIYLDVIMQGTWQNEKICNWNVVDKSADFSKVLTTFL